MKPRCSKPGCLCGAMAVAALLCAPVARPQTPPALSVQWSGGSSTLSVTGTTGSFCTVQYAPGLSPTDRWQFLTNFVQPANARQIGDATAAASRRFYRAFSQRVPTNIVTTNMVWLPPGTFTMGSPTDEAERYDDETLHSVTLTKGFFMGKNPVTQADYQATVGNNPSSFTGDLRRPVEQISWFDATNYCGQLTQREQAAGRVPADWAYRLPTEAEWEYACRSGTTTAFHFGNALRSGMENFDGRFEYDAALGTINNAGGVFLQSTTAAGSYRPNAWGLFDMHGNVWQWCQDRYGSYPTGSVTDPQGASTGFIRVIRGGAWDLAGVSCRSASRALSRPDATANDVGFRVVLAPSP